MYPLIFICFVITGGCKHATAFIMWLHRRSEQPSVTSQVCYWKASKLSKAAIEQDGFKLEDLVDREIPPLRNKDNNFLEKVKCLSGTGPLYDVYKKFIFEDISLFHLIENFQGTKIDKSVENFMNFVCKKMENSTCKKAEIATQNQSKSSQWFKLRWGRITASKFYEAAHCRTTDGSLIETILGASKPIETTAMLRGKTLEPEVLKIVETIRNIKILKCGLILNKEYPFFGASPDGLSKEYCIEVKCPSKNKTVENYIKDGEINKKYLSQMQLQMLFAKKNKSLFCIASPNFEHNKEVDIYEVDFNQTNCNNMLDLALLFWKNAVFPKICK